MAGLSAAIYLGRSKRQALVVESGHSMAVWEPDVQNYLGFPQGVAGRDLLHRGRMQARRFGAHLVRDEIRRIVRLFGGFELHGNDRTYRAQRVLLATGLTHLPPEVPGVRDCLGRSLFFCKDCDAFRVQGRRIVIIGRRNEAAEYALAMLAYSPFVLIATNGKPIEWDDERRRWLNDYGVQIREEPIAEFRHHGGRLSTVRFSSGPSVAVAAGFVTRGDRYHTDLAEGLGVKLTSDGEVSVDGDMRTSIPGLYAAGCVTPANCQMIVAAGQGAAAAQAINRDLFEESLHRRTLKVWKAA